MISKCVRKKSLIFPSVCTNKTVETIIPVGNKPKGSRGNRTQGNIYSAWQVDYHNVAQVPRLCVSGLKRARLKCVPKKTQNDKELNMEKKFTKEFSILHLHLH